MTKIVQRLLLVLLGCSFGAGSPFPAHVQAGERAMLSQAPGALLMNIGPAMVADDDDPAHTELLAEVVPTGLFSSVVMAGEDGVYWRAVKAAARLVKALAENSPNGEANAAFTATAPMPPGTPFYPGS